MILDSETLGAGQRDRGGARGARRGRARQARAAGAGARDRDHAAPGHARRPASSCARCARAVSEAAERRGLCIGSAGTHPFAMWEDQRVSSRPRYRELIAALRFVARQEIIFGLHVHVGRRRPRQGDPRRQRDARARADPARAGGQLAVLARRRHRLRLDADADLPRLPARRHPALLRGLGRLRAPDRLHGRLRRDRGLHLPLVRRAAAPELRHRRDPRDGRADAGRAHAGAGGADPGDGQGAGRALRGRQAARPLPVRDARREQVAGRAARAGGRAGRPARAPAGPGQGARQAALRPPARARAGPRLGRRARGDRRTSSSTATARSASAWSTRRTTTTAR